MIVLVPFCLERTTLSLMSALLESTAEEDLCVQLKTVRSVVDIEHTTETCCICQACILETFFRLRLLAVHDKVEWIVAFLLIIPFYMLYKMLRFVLLFLNMALAIPFTNIMADGCENGHVFCEYYYLPFIWSCAVLLLACLL